MQNFMVMLLTGSIALSVYALVFIASMPFLRRRYSAKGLYYAWLIIVIGLIVLPFRPQFDNAIIKIVLINPTARIVQTGDGIPITEHIENTAAAVTSSSISWWQIAVIVWLSGASAFLGYLILKHRRFKKTERRWSEIVTSKQTLTLLQGLKTEMDISQQIGLYRCLCIGSPMMLGFVHPRVLLPETDFTQDELHYILMHELVHYKRKDLWYKCLVVIAVAIHWFNPIVYLLAKVIEMQCEISCDAEVVRSMDVDTRQHYSEIIIGVVQYQSKMKTVLSTNFYGGKKGMKKRISSIMDMGKKKAGIAIIVGVLLVTIGASLAFAVNVPDRNKALAPKETRTPQFMSDPISTTTSETKAIYDPDTNGDPNKGNFAFSNAAPGEILKSNRTYKIESGESVFSFVITWTAMGNPIEVGLLNVDDNSVYTVTVTSGSASEETGMEDIPNGEYQVIVINPDTNNSSITGAISYGLATIKT